MPIGGSLLAARADTVRFIDHDSDIPDPSVEMFGDAGAARGIQRPVTVPYTYPSFATPPVVHHVSSAIE